jgi:hypothetical protein
MHVLLQLDGKPFINRASPHRPDGAPIAYAFADFLPFVYCLLPIVYCLLPIAYCLLPIACCLLPIAYCLLQSAHL